MIQPQELDTMSRDELEELKAEIDKALTRVETRLRKSALADIEKIAADAGLSLSDLLNQTSKGKGKATSGKSKMPPKYRHPTDPNKSWGGHGRRPNWVIEHVDAGKSLEDLAV